MIKSILLSFAFFSFLMARPVSVLGDVSSTLIQQEANQLQTNINQNNQQQIDLQELEKQKTEIHIKQQKSAPQSRGPSFKVNEIVLEGNTLFSTPFLDLYVEPYEGRVLHLKDLQDLALLITAQYERAGYMTSRAYVPPQKIKDGKVIIRILEGRVGTIEIKGNQWFPTPLYLDRVNLYQGDIFDMQQLSMSLEDINELPDRTVKAYLEPGQEPGTSDIILVAQEQNPIHASYEYNMRGTDLTYLSRNIFHFTDNNLTGHGDSLQTSMSYAEQNSLSGGMIQYVLPQPREGLSYSFNGGYDYTRLEKYLRPLKVTSKTFFVSPGVTKTFYKSPKLKVDGFVGFEMKDAWTLVDRNKLSFDRSRVLDMGPRVAIDDKWGKTFISGDLRGGIPDILGGSELHDPEASRIHSGGEFVYLTGNVDRINHLPYGTYLVLHAGGQYSPMPLTSLEQFYLGGMYSVRGYPENDSSGDSGLNFSAELRIPPYFIPPGWHVFNSKDKTWRETLSLVAFLDGGRVFNYYRQSADASLDRTLLSTGVGVKYYVSPDINCQAGIGFPFGDKSTDGKHAEPYVSARLGF